MEALPCNEHPGRPAPRRCSSCGRWLCVECWRFNVDGLPWCAPCVALIKNKKDRLPVSFALTALLLAAGFAVAAVRGGILNGSWAALLVAVVALFVVGTVRSMRGETSLLSREIAEVKDGVAGRPKRKIGRIARRALESTLPSWSSKTTVLVILAGFGLAALLVPAALRLPRFAEAEVVVVAWLGILWACLAITLYRGARLGDDHVLHIRAPDFVLRAALTRVTNDAHECAGSVPRALSWGFLWSGLYTAPLAVFVALLHWSGR